MRITANGRHGWIAALRAAGVLALAVCAVAEPATGSAEISEVALPPVVGEARFPHDLHAEELGFECAECHHETAAARLRMPHEDYFEDFWIDCRVCHRETGEVSAPQSCDVCHHSRPSSTADETLSAKVVIHRSCWGCHDSGTGADASNSCGFCHQAGEPRPEAGQ